MWTSAATDSHPNGLPDFRPVDIMCAMRKSTRFLPSSPLVSIKPTMHQSTAWMIVWISAESLRITAR
jgi:hypothetical protein